MPPWKVPLADVSVPEEDIEAVAEVLRSGWLSMGPKTEELEEDFAAYTGAAHALAVANGTAALHLQCLAAGLGPGDEVVTPSMTFVASVNAIRYTGATPVFADIAGLREPWLSAESVSRVLTERTKAVMYVDYGGFAGEVDAIARLCADRGVLLLEDAAHAAGSQLGDHHLGRIGAAGAFSFFSNKNLAVGEGGMVITDDDAIAAKVKLLRSHAMTSLSWDRHRGHAATYDVVDLGFNYRIDEPRAELVRARLRRLDAENTRRRDIVARYRSLLDGVDGLSIALPERPDERSALHLFVVVLDEGVDRHAFREALSAARVQTSMHYPPAHRFSIYDDGTPAELPVTEAYGARAVTLPLFASMTEEQQDVVVDAVRSALD